MVAVRSIIYGTEEDLDAFLTAERLVNDGKFFNIVKERLTRYTIRNEQNMNVMVVGPDFQVLDFASVQWTVEDRLAWEQLLAVTKVYNLNHEFVLIDSWKKIVYKTSERAIGYLSISTPQIRMLDVKDQDIPLHFL